MKRKKTVAKSILAHNIIPQSFTKQGFHIKGDSHLVLILMPGTYEEFPILALKVYM